MRMFEVNSDENSCGDDSDFSDKVGIERRLIKPQIKPPVQSIQLPRERKEESMMNILKFQYSTEVANNSSLSSKPTKKDSDDDSSADEAKKLQEREITEEFLRNEIPVPQFGTDINSKFLSQLNSAAPVNEEDILKQLEVIRKSVDR